MKGYVLLLLFIYSHSMLNKNAGQHHEYRPRSLPHRPRSLPHRPRSLAEFTENRPRSLPHRPRSLAEITETVRDHLVRDRESPRSSPGPSLGESDCCQCWDVLSFDRVDRGPK